MCKLQQSFTLIVLLILIVAVGAQAFPVRMMNVREMLDESDAVYKITVQSTREEGVWKDTPAERAYLHLNNHAYDMPRVIASAKVLSTIKGKARNSVGIEFPGFPHGQKFVVNWPMYTGLSKGLTCIVFLKTESSPARFADSQTGAILVPAKAPARSYGDGSEDKLLAELVSAAQNGDDYTRKSALEQLGKLSDNRAKDVLRGPSKSTDLAQRTAGLVARIGVGDAPAQKDLLAILSMYPADMTSHGGGYMGKLGPFYSMPEQREIVDAVCATARHIRGCARPLKGFDYVGFVRKSLGCRVIKENVILRSDLVGILRDLGNPKSMPLLLKLLDDPSQVVRYMAATSFAVLAKDNKWFPAGEIFNKNEAKYIKHCREWAKEHPDGI